ncbi:GNAT family N-acetyltransferase [Granulosicoccus sp. 3-233]|uniref:GNAT family N-acetyltransferase n=1 Tax=Granulosicoccus sp. 3-233 TaxID=3417969 RepID=UPI003D357D16
MLQLRSASEGDAESVARILVSARLAYLPFAPSAHSPDAVRRWVGNNLIPSGGVVVAQLDDENVGVLAISESGGIGWIDQLYMAPGHVNQGIGSQLLEHALSLLPRPIHLWTFQENHGAIRFYQRHGFKAIRYTDGAGNEEKCPDMLFEYP